MGHAAMPGGFDQSVHAQHSHARPQLPGDAEPPAARSMLAAAHPAGPFNASTEVAAARTRLC